MATTCLSYYYCFCSVDKSHNLHRRWINTFSQLQASHNVKTKCYYFNSGPNQKLKVHKNRELQFFSETHPDSGIRANNSQISSRKAGHVIPIPLLVLGNPVVFITTRNGLLIVIFYFSLDLYRTIAVHRFLINFCCFCVFCSFQLSQNFDIVTCLSFQKKL